MECNKIICGDCLELFRAIPSDSIDMAFADPPFNLQKEYGECSDDMSHSDYLEWCKKWIAEMVRVTKPTGSIFIHNIPKWLLYYAPVLNECATFKNWIAWNAPSSSVTTPLTPYHYGFLWYTKSNPKFYKIRHPHIRDRKTGHLSRDYGGKKYLLHPFGPLVSDVWVLIRYYCVFTLLIEEVFVLNRAGV